MLRLLRPVTTNRGETCKKNRHKKYLNISTFKFLFEYDHVTSMSFCSN